MTKHYWWIDSIQKMTPRRYPQSLELPSSQFPYWKLAQRNPLRQLRQME
jgi:hypothetical protein